MWLTRCVHDAAFHFPFCTCYGLVLTYNFHQANAFSPNWGQVIFQSANEMANNALVRKRMDELQSQVAAEKEWWEKRKATIQSDFMKELDDESGTSKGLPSAAATGGASLATGVVTPSAVVRNGSDDDAVLVEAGGKQDQQGGGKKKKGKK